MFVNGGLFGLSCSFTLSHCNANVRFALRSFVHTNYLKAAANANVQFRKTDVVFSKILSTELLARNVNKRTLAVHVQYERCTIEYVKEHLNTKKSSIYKHLTTCQNTHQDIQVNIITRDNDNVNLRLKEA